MACVRQAILSAASKACCPALSGIEQASEMLYNAFREGTRIVVVGDFDADGATSTALSVLSLRALGCDNVAYGAEPV